MPPMIPFEQFLDPTLRGGSQAFDPDNKDTPNMKFLQEQITALQKEVTSTKANNIHMAAHKNTLMAHALENEEKSVQMYAENQEAMLHGQLYALEKKHQDLKRASKSKIIGLEAKIAALDKERRELMGRDIQMRLMMEMGAKNYDIQQRGINQEMECLRQDLQAAQNNAAAVKKAALDLIVHHQDVERSIRENDGAMKKANGAFLKLKEAVEKL